MIVLAIVSWLAVAIDGYAVPAIVSAEVNQASVNQLTTFHALLSMLMSRPTSSIDIGEIGE
jgi:hypothetical protein